MPELPEVETIVVGLRPLLAGRHIVTVSHCDWPPTLAGYAPDAFCADLTGDSIRDVDRRAKYILLVLESDRVLAIHLRMTGGLVYHPAPVPPDKATRLIFDLEDGGQLHFTDARKFGRVRLLAPPEVGDFLGLLGPEPLPDAFTVDRFRERFRNRRGQLKPALLDQRVLAGLGNIYADEALFHSQLHPQRPIPTLGEEDTERLYRAIRAVLSQGIANRGTSISDYRDAQGEKGSNQQALHAYGQTGQPCSRCGTPIERTVVGGRGTHFCPRCQVLVV
ncbi:MAG TPA: bifunctional DNA-formamidopyrimidine glycosylase/DNA-(apurinic or apyrimidinic site) lyase [Chloroflexia bacterium]|nr:bifunctional DNA-formamidopyrimidine glycosylase/DNA-(apurinic or apyrimidinic site) lyase [Chloroflexia bacterium]